MKQLHAISLCVLAAFIASPLQAAETRKAEPGREAPKASVADLAWIQGAWSGKGLGGDSHAVYSAPYDGQIVGHFRQGKDGKVQFYEIVAIAEVNGSLEYRVKHFNADMTGWEDKNDMEKFSLVAVEKDVWYFDGLTVRRNGQGLVETVLIERKDGTTFEAAFTYGRAK